jgi:hypothetical protein
VREGAAEKLAGILLREKPLAPSIHFVGHSHGGNVIERALHRAWRGIVVAGRGRNLLRVQSVACVGTPFIARRLPLRHLLVFNGSYIGAWVLLILMLGLLLWALLADPGKVASEVGWPTYLGVVGAIVVIAYTWLEDTPPPVFYWLIRYTGIVSIPIRLGRRGDRWLSIWHPNDEAIFALQAIGDDKTVYMTPRALSRALERYSVEAAMALVVALLGFPLLGAALAGVTPGVASLTNEIYGAALAFLFILAVGLYALSIGALYMPPLADFLNRRTARVIRSAAYGRDQAEILRDAATVPSELGGIEFCIGGNLADRMASDALAKLQKHIADHKRPFMLVNGGTPATGIFASVIDSLKGGELIHTSYFDYDEIVDRLADHIARHTV